MIAGLLIYSLILTSMLTVFWCIVRYGLNGKRLMSRGSIIVSLLFAVVLSTLPLILAAKGETTYVLMVLKPKWSLVWQYMWQGTTRHHRHFRGGA